MTEFSIPRGGKKAAGGGHLELLPLLRTHTSQTSHGTAEILDHTALPRGPRGKTLGTSRKTGPSVTGRGVSLFQHLDLRPYNLRTNSQDVTAGHRVKLLFLFLLLVQGGPESV